LKFQLNSILGIIGALFVVPNKYSYDAKKQNKKKTSQQLTRLRNSFCIYMSKTQQSSLAYRRMNNSYPDGEDNRGLAGQQTNRHVPLRTCLSLDKTEETLATACTTQTLPMVRSQKNTKTHTLIFLKASGRQKR